jgi:hypothetical protein
MRLVYPLTLLAALCGCAITETEEKETGAVDDGTMVSTSTGSGGTTTNTTGTATTGTNSTGTATDTGTTSTTGTGTGTGTTTSGSGTSTTGTTGTTSSGTSSTSYSFDDPIDFQLVYLDHVTMRPIASLERCILEPTWIEPTCQTTDAFGDIFITWDNVRETRFAIEAVATDYRRTVAQGRYDEEIAGYWADEIATTGQKRLEHYIWQERHVEAFYTGAGFTLREGRGEVHVRVESWTGASVVGAEVSFSEVPASIAYISDDGVTPDMSLFGVSGSGAAVVADVTPGEHILAVTHPELICTAGGAWPTDSPNRFEVNVDPDSTTFLTVTCDVPTT